MIRVMKESFGHILLGLAVLLLAGCAEVQTERPRFAQRNCLDCHKKFGDKYLGMKNVHPTVKAQQCESCHLRHGLIPKAVMKKDGNEVCYQCHARDKVGLNRKHVHTALKKTRCTECHDPHASPASHLLRAEGDEVCYRCHKKEEHQRKVVHRASPTKGCLACHSAHSSDEKDLLLKAAVPLCLSCHDAATPQFKKAHEGYPVEKAASCAGCHNPHSSAQAKLLKTSAHGPAATGQCEACHKAAASPKPFETVDAPDKLCANCHDAADLAFFVAHHACEQGRRHTPRNNEADVVV